jgi:type II secretory pathway predicted ATPase ExeA
MRVDVMEHYSLGKPLDHVGYYETAHHKQLLKDIKGAIWEGKLIAVCGVVGSGKTVLLRRLTKALKEEKKIIVSKSVAVDKHNVKLGTLIEALYYDLSAKDRVKIPKKIEDRDRQLQELIVKGKKPVVLLVDEAHDLNGHTLTGLKRLMELAQDVDGLLSVVLAGHPKLRNDLLKDTMEEIGYRTAFFTLDGIASHQREYIEWLLHECTDGKTPVDSILAEDAIVMLSTKLRTPLQIQLHLSRALEAGYDIGGGPVSAETVETVMSRHIDDMEPTLTRHGYRMKDLVEVFDAKPAEFKALFNNELDAERAAEIRGKLLAAGLPI